MLCAMKALELAVKECEGQTALARAIGVPQQVVWAWLNRGDQRPPPERSPAIELATRGNVTVEQLRPDVRWARIPDPDWPHPDGRPTIDVAAPSEV